MKWRFGIPARKEAVRLIVEQGLLEEGVPKRLNELERPIALITDEAVASLYAEKLCRNLQAGHLFTFPPGEQNKTQPVATQLQQQMLEAGLGRDAAIVGMGGGVVTDLAGYVASTYCRGIPLLLVPTTLLGMVDASIGGKTGVNFGEIKNYIGTTYQPEAILIDPKVLLPQPIESFRDGLVEMVKHGLIADVTHFEWVEENCQRLLEKDFTILEKGIVDSALIKMSIVLQDAHESGMRRMLNLGHTIGHALETSSGYTLSHGTAVALGVLVELRLSHFDETLLLRVARLFRKMGISFDGLEAFSQKDLARLLSQDKKALGRQPRFVTLKGIGEVEAHGGTYCTAIEPNEVKKALEWMCYDLCELARP